MHICLSNLQEIALFGGNDLTVISSEHRLLGTRSLGALYKAFQRTLGHFSKRR